MVTLEEALQEEAYPLGVVDQIQDYSLDALFVGVEHCVYARGKNTEVLQSCTFHGTVTRNTGGSVTTSRS